jgi:hypothetical protein
MAGGPPLIQNVTRSLNTPQPAEAKTSGNKFAGSLWEALSQRSAEAGEPAVAAAPAAPAANRFSALSAVAPAVAPRAAEKSQDVAAATTPAPPRRIVEAAAQEVEDLLAEAGIDTTGVSYSRSLVTSGIPHGGTLTLDYIKVTMPTGEVLNMGTWAVLDRPKVAAAEIARLLNKPMMNFPWASA